MCNCRKICRSTVISSSVTVVTVNGVNTLVIDVPEAVYRDGERLALIVAQAIPATATVGMPVALGIGGVTEPVYPLVNCVCEPVTACAVRERGVYEVVVKTSATGANIRVISGLSCSPCNRIRTIPVAATTA